MVSETGRRWIRISAWLIATALIVLLVRRVDVRRALGFVERIQGWWLAPAVASNLLIQPLGALQWRSLLPAGIPIAWRRLLRLFSLTSVANNTTPSLIGHATGALLIAAEPGVGKGAALSLLAVDQIAVGLVKLAVLLAASALLPLPGWMVRGLDGLAVVVAILLVASILVARRTRHLAILREPGRLVRGLAFAFAVKVAEAGAILSVQRAFGLELPLPSVIVVLAATALGSVVPIAPANIGTYEAATYGAYRFLGLGPEAALGIAVVQHACQLLAAVAPGYLLLSLPASAQRTPSLQA